MHQLKPLTSVWYNVNGSHQVEPLYMFMKIKCWILRGE